ncbi:MAG: hypothetical protein M0R17_01250 [Candidatus Omnitrophica bacterium]|jgi:hypothetical protein|nr:hypothetical protein [Candidatus Omnitrophota bacterium]
MNTIFEIGSLIWNHLVLYNLIGVVVLIGVLYIEIRRDVGLAYSVANPCLLVLIPLWPLLILEQLVIAAILLGLHYYHPRIKKPIHKENIVSFDANSMYTTSILPNDSRFSSFISPDERRSNNEIAIK